MSKPLRFLLPLVVLAMLALPSLGSAAHQDDPRSTNVVPLGESFEAGSFLTTPAVAQSDLAFWANLAIEGSYDGFRFVDISNPANPVEISDVACNGNQGDITVWRNVLVRSVDRAQALPGDNLANACQGTDTPGGAPGFEGLQVFDISDIRNPRFVTAVPTDCGSHTHTQFRDAANNRLIIYVSRGGGNIGPSPYGNTCVDERPDLPGSQLPRITAVEVPLANPAAARIVNNNIPAGTNGCHDVAVFEEIREMFGACRPNVIHWDLTDPVNPRILHEMTIQFAGPPALTGWHSASFSWDGKILIGGWEPGGGSAPECEATDHPIKKSTFFWSATSGQLLGMWTLPRPQSSAENCTVHNYNVVPFKDRHVLVQGSYQSGWSAVDFTNPGAAFEFAWSDPPPLTPTQLGGAWSTYWYNDLAVESDITTGLRLYTIAERWWRGAFDLTRLNPQTQETLLRCVAHILAPRTMRARQRTGVTVHVIERGGPAAGEPVTNQRVTLRGPGIRLALTTNGRGVARAVGVAASRAGTLRATVPAQLNMSGCTVTKRIRPALRPPRPGPALTGRAR